MTARPATADCPFSSLWWVDRLRRKTQCPHEKTHPVISVLISCTHYLMEC